MQRRNAKPAVSVPSGTAKALPPTLRQEIAATRYHMQWLETQIEQLSEPWPTCLVVVDVINAYAETLSSLQTKLQQLTFRATS